MFKKGEKIMYGIRGVYDLVDVREETVLGKKSLYYVLRAKGDKPESLVFVPCDNKELTASMRRLLSKSEVKDIIANMSSYPPADWPSDSKVRRELYKNAFASGNRDELIGIIKAIYLNSEKRKKEGKKSYVTDENAMHKAEKLIYSEFAEVLGVSEDEILAMIIEANG